MAYLTPQFANSALRTLASDWRVSGIINANTGNWLTVTTTSDLAFDGIPGQRVNQVPGNPYGAKTLTNYLSAAAFALPASGTLGNEAARGFEGPGFWKIDVSLARVLSLVGRRTLELRVEVFNLLNNFNWGDPNQNLNAGTFGQITTQTAIRGSCSLQPSSAFEVLESVKSEKLPPVSSTAGANTHPADSGVTVERRFSPTSSPA